MDWHSKLEGINSSRVFVPCGYWAKARQDVEVVSAAGKAGLDIGGHWWGSSSTSTSGIVHQGGPQQMAVAGWPCPNETVRLCVIRTRRRLAGVDQSPAAKARVGASQPSPTLSLWAGLVGLLARAGCPPSRMKPESTTSRAQHAASMLRLQDPGRRARDSGPADPRDSPSGGRRGCSQDAPGFDHR